MSYDELMEHLIGMISAVGIFLVICIITLGWELLK